MKLRFNCMKCQEVFEKPSEEFISLELTDDGIYPHICKHGHFTMTSIQQLKFEILFDIGINALLDGYPREAVATVASSLERFYEFYIDVICLKNNVSQELFKQAWNEVRKQSERQYGAYLFLQLIDDTSKTKLLTIYDESPEGMKDTWSAFRNKVVHQGYIPPKEDAFKYIDMVYRHICQIISQLKHHNEKYIQDAILKHISRIHQKAEGATISFMSISTIISLSRGDKQADILEDAINPSHLKWQYHH